MVTIGLLLDEFGHKHFGGVSTWGNYFVKMMSKYSNFNVVVIFCYDNKDEILGLPKNIKFIDKNSLRGLKHIIKDVDIIINSLWSTVKLLKYLQDIPIITIIHSLIKKELKTNFNFCGGQVSLKNQEDVFYLSKHIVFVSESDQKYFLELYPEINVTSSYIYNVYEPEYTHVKYNSLNSIGYIGRFVPRKRPELCILGLEKINRLDVKCLFMGNHGGDKGYWKSKKEKYKNLELIPENFNKYEKDVFFNKIGIGSFTTIYEPFGYSLCEFIDRGIPVIVGYVDGPKEIIKGFEEFVYPYQVFQNYEKDIESYSKTLKHVLSLSHEVREKNAQNARKILEKLKPEIIVEEWKKLILNLVK